MVLTTGTYNLPPTVLFFPSPSTVYRLHSTASPTYNLPPTVSRPIQIDTSTPSCGNSRYGCWTCTVVVVARDGDPALPGACPCPFKVVDRDKASEGLLASGDERMEKLIDFRETLPNEYWPSPSGRGCPAGAGRVRAKRDSRRMNGNNGPGPLVIPSEARNLALSLVVSLPSGIS